MSSYKELGLGADWWPDGVNLLCCSALQSLVLGESVSMYTPANDQRNFYEDLMVIA